MLMAFNKTSNARCDERRFRMALDDRLSRRSVVATGVKLAYATPFVAASTTLSTGIVGAAPVISGPTCDPPSTPCDPFDSPIRCCSGTCAFVEFDEDGNVVRAICT